MFGYVTRVGTALVVLLFALAMVQPRACRAAVADCCDSVGATAEQSAISACCPACGKLTSAPTSSALLHRFVHPSPVCAAMATVEARTLAPVAALRSVAAVRAGPPGPDVLRRFPLRI